MYTHAPSGYRCPFCAIAHGIEADYLYTKQDDIIYRDDTITAFIASHWWPENHGHVILIPNAHFENLYDIPDDVLCAIHAFSKRVAIALRETYSCAGTSVRQHNEPAGDQDVWHYHLHVFPRYASDNLYLATHQKRLSTTQERFPYAETLRQSLLR